MSTTAKSLALWANGQRVGSWSPAGRSAAELRYDPRWLESPEARPLSLSLPLPAVAAQTVRGVVVDRYFDNLLPDSQRIRERLATRYGANSPGAFDLLAAIGRDCVGALQIVAEADGPDGFDRIEGRRLSDDDIAALLRGAVATPAPGAADGDDLDALRISIAGAQEKTALLRHKGRWLLPRGATPTTHILKMPLGLVGQMQADMRTSVYNEWLCLRLLAGFGIPVAHADIAGFADHPPVLVVERFDRRLHDSASWIVRLPQEDFCQALGVGPERKYESDGGPGVAALASVLRASRTPADDLANLVRSQVVFGLLAATDGHAKNFSLKLLAGGAFQMTPLYDVVSLWPVIGKGRGQIAWQKVKLAMALPGESRHYALSMVMRRHYDDLAARFTPQLGPALVDEVLARVDAAIEQATAELPTDFPEDVATKIFAGMRQQRDRWR